MKKLELLRVLISIYIILSISSKVLAKEVSFTLEDRDRIIRIETTIKEFKEAIDKRFEQVDKRFEQVDKRFEQVDKRFEQMTTFIWMLIVVFIGITSVTIGFAIWDRRTMIRPFESRIKELEGEIEGIEIGKVERLILTLRELAKKDTQVAAALNRFNLL